MARPTDFKRITAGSQPRGPADPALVKGRNSRENPDAFIQCKCRQGGDQQLAANNSDRDGLRLLVDVPLSGRPQFGEYNSASTGASDSYPGSDGKLFEAKNFVKRSGTDGLRSKVDSFGHRAANATFTVRQCDSEPHSRVVTGTQKRQTLIVPEENIVITDNDQVLPVNQRSQVSIVPEENIVITDNDQVLPVNQRSQVSIVPEENIVITDNDQVLPVNQRSQVSIVPEENIVITDNDQVLPVNQRSQVSIVPEENIVITDNNQVLLVSQEGQVLTVKDENQVTVSNETKVLAAEVQPGMCLAPRGASEEISERQVREMLPAGSDGVLHTHKTVKDRCVPAEHVGVETIEGQPEQIVNDVSQEDDSLGDWPTDGNQGYVRALSDDSWYLHGPIGSKTVEWLIDSGAGPNLLDYGVYASLDASKRPRLVKYAANLLAAGGTQLKVNGEVVAEVRFGEFDLTIPVVIADLGGLEGILGN